MECFIGDNAENMIKVLQVVCTFFRVSSKEGTGKEGRVP